MNETLRALVVVLVLSVPVHLWVRYGWRGVVDESTVARRAAAWLGLTVLVFVLPSFWAFTACVVVVSFMLQPRERHLLAPFVLLLYVLPAFPVRIGGLGVLNQLAELHYVRILALALLLPQWWRSRRMATGPVSAVDLCVFGFVLLRLLLQLRDDTLTNTLRYACYAAMDVLLPYLVARQSMADERTRRDVLACYVWACCLLSALAVFEFGKHWLLYREVAGHMGESWGMGSYLLRNDSLRAIVSAGHSLVLGFTLVVAIGVAFAQARRMEPLHRALLATLLGAGLFATLSRGPWVGAGVVCLVAVLAGANPLRRSLQLVAALLPVLAVLAFTPYGSRLYDLLPFVGTVDEFNVDYRRRLLDVSWTVIQYNPWLGSTDFLSAQEMQEMVQGEGIIDLVNSYIEVTLAYGLVGLALYGGAFFFAALGVWRRLRAARPGSQLHDTGRALLAAMLGVMVTIGTTSNINNITIICWMLVGWCAGYARYSPALQRRPVAGPAAGAGAHQTMAPPRPVLP